MWRLLLVSSGYGRRIMVQCSAADHPTLIAQVTAMIANETLAGLEFDKLLAEIGRYAHSACAVERIHGVRPLGKISDIRTISGRVSEIRHLRLSGVSVALGVFEDIRPCFEILRPAGAVMPPLELLLFLPVLRLYAALSRQLSYRDDIPMLKSMEPQLRGFPDILEPLAASIDSDGSIMDSASSLLKEIRRAKRVLAARIRKKIEELIQSSGIEKFLQEDFITQRSGRWVIPVRMDSKGMVKGVVHDVSSSGETAFMEPLEIIPFVNELENLAAEEKAEEIRILRQLSEWLREDAEQISACFGTLLELDLLNSIACFADEYALEQAVINEAGGLRLVDARHPLLLIMQKKGMIGIVEPLGLELGGPAQGSSVMVITGPNAGGKTIALKTSGMLSLMALSGIPVSAGPGSTFPLIDRLMIDIGDDQSIEHSHSTFSAHAARIAAIIGQSGARTMVLLDELGAGTEPLQGAAIACGVLHELRLQGSMVIATTHLSDIIGFVHQTSGMINAGMAFDDGTFTPLYRLVVGEPGQSHAVEIARRFGMPEQVIDFARKMLGNAGSEFTALLGELRQRRTEYENMYKSLEARERSLDRRSDELDARADEVRLIRKEAAEKGWSDARELISATRRKMNGLLDELKREKRSEIVDELRQAEKELVRQLQPQVAEPDRAPLKSIKQGDAVYIGSLGCRGVLLTLDSRHGKARVRAGRMELDVPFADLSDPGESVQPDRMKASAAPWRVNAIKDEQRELKLIGLRVEEALAELEPFINHAAAAGLGEVRVIHGLGTGRLKDAVREELARHPLVDVFRPGESHEGRDGATVVKLRT